MPKFKLKLVSDWRQAWRWFSVHAMLLAVSLQGAWLAVPDDIRGHLSRYAPAVSMVILVCGIIGRLVDQSHSEDKQ